MDNQFTDRIAQASGLTPQQVHDCLKALAQLTADEAQPLPEGLPDEVQRFWQCFADAVAAGRMVNNEDFRMDGGRLFMIAGPAYLAYTLHYRNRYHREGMNKQYIMAALKKHASYVTDAPSIWVGKRKTSAMVFDRPLLPVTIPPGVGL